MICYQSATWNDITYLHRLNFLAEVAGDEYAAIPDPAAYQAGRQAYLGSWEPRHGGIIAWDDLGIPAGGAWLSYGSPACHGYGYLGPDIPELSLAIEPRYRGQGIGRELLNRIIMQAHTAVSLAVHDDNTIARHLYARAGFHFMSRVAETPYSLWKYPGP